MKIGMIHLNLATESGDPRMFLSIAQGLRRLGHEVAVYAAAQPRSSSRIYHQGIPDRFIKQARRSVILERLGLSPAGIHSFVKSAIAERVNEHSVKG